MPEYFRAMKSDSKDQPQVGDQRDQLGVRLNIDMKPDKDGMVFPGPKGMSVFNAINKLPAHLVPGNLGGPGELALFCIEDTHVQTEHLALHMTNEIKGHAVIAPAKALHIDHYQKALADTKPEWKVVA